MRLRTATSEKIRYLISFKVVNRRSKERKINSEEKLGAFVTQSRVVLRTEIRKFGVVENCSARFLERA